MKNKITETKIENLVPDNLNANKGTDQVIIYLYRCPKTKIPIYVGKTINLNKRIHDHLNDARRNSNTKFHNWRRKNATVMPEILEFCANNTWKERECYWIGHFRNDGFDLKNIQAGGEGLEKGHKFSNETLSRMSKSASNKFAINSKIKEQYSERYGKLNLTQLENIFIDYHERNISTNDLALKYKIAQSTISKILYGKRYSHLVKYFIYYYGIPNEKISTKNKNKTIKKVCSDYLNGMDIDNLKAKYKIHRVTIFKFIKIGTGKTYQKHEKYKIRQNVLELYATTDLNKQEIAQRLNLDYSLICRILTENSLKNNHEEY